MRNRIFGIIALGSSISIAYILFSRPVAFNASSLFDWYFLVVSLLFLVAAVFLLKK